MTDPVVITAQVSSLGIPSNRGLDDLQAKVAAYKQAETQWAVHRHNHYDPMEIAQRDQPATDAPNLIEQRDDHLLDLIGEAAGAVLAHAATSTDELLAKLAFVIGNDLWNADDALPGIRADVACLGRGDGPMSRPADLAAILATTTNSHPAVLEMSLRAQLSYMQHCRATDRWPDDDDLRVAVDHGADLAKRVEALPNTPDNLRLRALAIGVATDSTDDLANLDLGELSAHANGIVGRLVRQVLTCAMALPIAPTVSPPPVEPSPFSMAHGRYVAARDAFAPMPGDETVPAWAAAEREFLAAAEAVDATPVASWAEFGDAFLCACDGGDSTLTTKAKHKLLADVRRLQAQDRTDLSGWGEPHMGWLATCQAARAIIDVARTEADEAAPEYQAAVARLHRAEDLLLTEPARSRPAVLARLYTAVKVSSEGSEIDTALTMAMAEEAEAAFSLGAKMLV